MCSAFVRQSRRPGGGLTIGRGARLTAVLGVASVLVGACTSGEDNAGLDETTGAEEPADADPGENPTAEGGTSPEGDASAEGDASPTAAMTPGDADGEFAHRFAEPVTWSQAWENETRSNHFTLRISRIVVRSRQRLAEMAAVSPDGLDDSIRTVITMEVGARNASGHTHVGYHPERGELIVGGEQVEPAWAAFDSDDLAEDPWFLEALGRPGAVSWPLRAAFPEVVGAGSARYLFDGVHGELTAETADADITVDWPVPPEFEG